MIPTGFAMWQQLADAWGFLASLILVSSVAVIWRGPAWIAAYSAHKIGLCEQHRLDRAFEAKLEYLTLRIRRMKAELEDRPSAMPAPQSTPPEVKKAA